MSQNAIKPKTKVLIVDDHPLMREGLVSRIRTLPNLEVCGEASAYEDALNQIRLRQPDIITVDIQLQDSNGLQLIEEVHRRYPTIKMLVISAHEESTYASRVLRAGAHGYVNKQEVQDKIIVAFKTILAGKRYVSPTLAELLVDSALGDHNASSNNHFDLLSNRELEIFEMIGLGKTTHEISETLFLSSHTIDTYRSRIRQKLGLKNGTELMQRAVQWVIEKK